MGRRRKPPAGAQAINGWLVIDKPYGLSSAAVVSRVRAMVKPLRIGHGGTLDPLATGVLPIALGEATKTVAWAMGGIKTYQFTLTFGEARATDDAEGAVTGTSPVRPETAQIIEILPKFIGSVRQRPPAYSALKVGGRRAYALARAGEAPELGERTIEINELELVSRPGPETATFRVSCGKGTYVRSLARDIASELGTLGYVSQLRRTRVGPFAETQAITLDKLEAFGHSAPAFEPLLPVETALDDIPALAVTGEQAALIRQGRSVQVFGTGGAEPRNGDAGSPAALSDGSVVCAMEGPRLVALARFSAGALRPVRVLNL